MWFARVIHKDWLVESFKVVALSKAMLGVTLHSPLRPDSKHHLRVMF
jgi:hypothetical protein